MPCLLCGVRPADKKGSHIIPAFIISSALSYKGARERDKELMFMLRKNGFGESYIGRKVLPGAIEEVKGRELTDEEIEKNDNPNVKDFIFCSSCEKKLGAIESYFAAEVHDKIIEDVFPLEESKKSYSLIKINYPQAPISRLFFLSIVWRVSISKTSALRLSDEAEKKLKTVVYDCLDEDINEVLEKCKIHFDRLFKFPLIVLFAKREEDSTKGIVYADTHRLPHFLIVNQFTLFYYEKERQLKSPPNSFFGLTDLIDKTELANVREKKFVIGKLSQGQVEAFTQAILKMMVDETRKEIRILFSKVHEIAYGTRPTDDVVYALTHKIVNSDSSAFDKYSYENISKQIADFMMERQDYFLQNGSFPRYQIGDKIPE